MRQAALDPTACEGKRMGVSSHIGVQLEISVKHCVPEERGDPGGKVPL